jgi:Flp pilus assembly protein TadB
VSAIGPVGTAVGIVIIVLDESSGRRSPFRRSLPADPARREEAVQVAARQLSAAVRHRYPMAVGLGLCVLLESVAAMLYTPWLWVGAAVLLGCLVLQLVQPRRLRRRIERLLAD